MLISKYILKFKMADMGDSGQPILLQEHSRWTDNIFGAVSGENAHPMLLEMKLLKTVDLFHRKSIDDGMCTNVQIYGCLG